MPKLMRGPSTKQLLADRQYELTLQEDAEEMLGDLLEWVLRGPTDLEDWEESDQHECWERWHEEVKAVAEALVLKRLLIRAGNTL